MHCAFIYLLNKHCLEPKRGQRWVGLDFPLPSLPCFVTLQIRSCGPAVGRWYPRGNVRKVETNTGKTWPRCYIRIENIRAEKASSLRRLQRPRRWSAEKGLHRHSHRAKICWPWCCLPAITLRAATPRIIYAMGRWRKSSSARGPWILGNQKACLCRAGREKLPGTVNHGDRRESRESADPPAEPSSNVFACFVHSRALLPALSL